MANAALAVVKGVSRGFLQSVGRIGSRPVRHHLQLVAFLGGPGVLAALVRRRHIGVGRRSAVQLHEMLGIQIRILFSIAAVSHRFAQERSEGFPESRKINPVLRAFRPGHARLHISQVHLELHGVIDLALARHPEHLLGAEIIFEGGTLLIRAPGGAQVGYGLFVDREKSHGGAVLRRHVANGGAIRHGQGGRAFAIKLDKLADHFLCAEQLRNVQDEVGGSDAFA